jgi:fructose-bisphosphate aldolase / 6-deoxy-5-ketofructose 1-phosphate synthase
MKRKDVKVPADVPAKSKGTYMDNFMRITHSSGNLMLFAGDQKLEHLNGDFFGKGIHLDDATPEHLFKIASKAKIGCFAVQLGLIARYGRHYKKVPYLVKLNSKTNLVGTKQKDPFSKALHTVEQVIEFKKNSGLEILGVGYTLYMGSEYETEQLAEAAQIIYNAHQHGLVTVLWIYPRGKAVKNEKDAHLIAGATGVAACLGSDFIKVSYPGSSVAFKEAIMSAGNTGVVCAGGGSTDVKSFLKTLHEQIHISGAKGNATGRNVHQKSLFEAVRMCNAIYAITCQGKSVAEAYDIYQSHKK